VNALVIEAVAIDGPSASGKTTVGRMVAERLGFGFLDTGLMYRAATWQAIQTGIGVHDGAALTRMAESMRVALVPANGSGLSERLEVDGVDVTDHLRTAVVDQNVSAVSAVDGVRRALVRQQREIAEERPMVMVGRDIGSVVLADAKVKIYLEASAEVRAKRRRSEMRESGQSAGLDRVLEEIERRDRIDSTRANSPLRAVEDAAIIRTDDMDVEEVVERIVRIAEGG